MHLSQHTYSNLSCFQQFTVSVFVCKHINSYAERNGTFSKENHMTTLNKMTTLLRKKDNILTYFVIGTRWSCGA